MRRLTVILCLTLTVLLGSASASALDHCEDSSNPRYDPSECEGSGEKVRTSTSGDLQKGMDAYKNKDYATALRELKPLGEQGNVRAQVYLGMMYLLGKGVPRDRTVAFKWVKRSAEKGYPLAQGFLGSFYENGRGVIQDNVRAHMWYNIAVSNGVKQRKKDLKYLGARMTKPQIEIAKDLAVECISKQLKGC